VNVPEDRVKTQKSGTYLKKLISFIFRSEIAHDELINVVYFFFVKIYFCFPDNSQKLYKMPATSNMADISAPSINTRTLLLKSAKASSFFFFLCSCMEGIDKSFKPKTRLSLLNLNSQRVLKNHQNLILEHFSRHVFPIRYNSESLEIYVVISRNILLFKDIKISLGRLITARKMHVQFRENR